MLVSVCVWVGFVYVYVHMFTHIQRMYWEKYGGRNKDECTYIKQ